MAILKSGSPSCGNRIYDGSFSGNKIDAMGIVAYWLDHHGIKVFNEDQISDADAYLQTLMPAAD